MLPKPRNTSRKISAIICYMLLLSLFTLGVALAGGKGASLTDIILINGMILWIMIVLPWFTNGLKVWLIICGFLFSSFAWMLAYAYITFVLLQYPMENSGNINGINTSLACAYFALTSLISWLISQRLFSKDFNVIRGIN